MLENNLKVVKMQKLFNFLEAVWGDWLGNMEMCVQICKYVILPKIIKHFTLYF